MMPPTTDKQLLQLSYFTTWLARGERGLSSEAIVSHLTGEVGRYSRPHHPLDPADFRRCQLLLKSHPLAELVFPQMRTASPEWARLVDVWEEIHQTILAEVPEYLTARPWGQRAPLGYALMQRVIAGGTTCEECAGSGQGDACEGCKGTGRRSGGVCRARRCYLGFRQCQTCRGRGFTVLVEQGV